jgi:excisionase family DNA binding protein
MEGADIVYENIPEVMTLKECQELLRVGKNTMLELLHTRQIEGFKIGSRWKVKKESVIEFLRYR